MFLLGTSKLINRTCLACKCKGIQHLANNLFGALGLSYSGFVQHLVLSHNGIVQIKVNHVSLVSLVRCKQGDILQSFTPV